MQAQITPLDGSKPLLPLSALLLLKLLKPPERLLG
jgi:hypothetical protein